MRVGDQAPDFSLPDENGTVRSLGEFLAVGPVVLFFYPAAMTTGCTAESCHFRDLAGDFATLGAQRLGISVDPVAKQKQFSQEYSFDFPLLSDADGEVARQFGVKRRFGPVPVKRSTFVIGADRRILGAIRNEFRMSVHADRALRVLRAS